MPYRLLSVALPVEITATLPKLDLQLLAGTRLRQIRYLNPTRWSGRCNGMVGTKVFYYQYSVAPRGIRGTPPRVGMKGGETPAMRPG